MAVGVAPRRRPWHAPGMSKRKFRSLRAYRRLLDRVILEAAEGKRPMGDVAKLSGAVKVATEAYMAESQLARVGLDQEVVDHSEGEDGGVPEFLSRTFVEKVVSYKKGISPKGTRIDETKVQVTGAEDEIDLDLIKDLL